MVKKIYLFVMFVIMVSIMPGISQVNAKSNINRKDEIIYATNYVNDYTTMDLLESFDYSFIGKIVSFVGVSQYNGNGMDIPYSFFIVNVVEIKKGELSSNIVIKFYGGYDENNFLHLLQGMKYPSINRYYKFYCNKSEVKFSQDGRTINDSYIISSMYNM